MTESIQSLFDRALSRLPESLRAPVENHWRAMRDHLPDKDAATWLTELPRVFVASDFVASNCAQRPALFRDLIDSGDLGQAYRSGAVGARVRAAVAGPANDAELKSALRTVRRREMVRLAFRDLAGWANLQEVVATLSELADASLDAALGNLYARAVEKHGQPIGERSGAPQRLVVLGLGKLGGEELNFSSDIDLIFCYPEEGETAAASSHISGRTSEASRDAESARGPRTRVHDVPPITSPIGETAGPRALSNHEFFLRLGQQLISVLSENTADGFVFRVDMRLRPNGASGPLALSFDAMEHYYQTHGRDWERYAFIKARVVAGDMHAGEELLKTLKPFVFRKYLDYSAIEAIRSMKVMIEREIARKGMEANVKLGRGGIREIEFIAQALQLIRAGREPKLQDRRVLAVLSALAARGYIEPQAAQELRAAYEFLRNVEHRLQMVRDEQTQMLPGDEPGCTRLAFSMGFDSWSGFEAALDAHRARVHAHFSKLFMQPLGEGAVETGNGLPAVWQEGADDAAAARILEEAGYAAPAEVLDLLRGLREGSAYQALSAEGRARFDRLMPLLLKSAAHCREPFVALGRVARVLEAIGRRTTYLALMVENPPVLEQLVRLAGASPWIAGWIAQHPIVLDELIDPRALTELPTREQLADELRQRLAHIPEEDLELQVEVLREFRHGHMLRVAAADTGTRLEATEVGRHLAAIAEVLIEESLGIASRDLVRKHGRPGGEKLRFAVIGYGKLGSLELGYSSDLDIIFIYDAPPESVTDGSRPLPSEQFYARLGQRLIHILTVRTPGGILYEVDMRLRPSGKSGPLVASLPAFREYQRTHAWTWEHQALVRARAIAGSPALCQAFGRVRHEILCQARDAAKLAAEVRDMRRRMLESHGSKEPGRYDLKHDRGGIVDIEFMVQYGVLRWAHEHPVLARHTDNIHLLQLLGAEGLFRPEVVETLAGAYRRYLSIEHHLKLMERGSRVEPAELGDLPEQVRRAWREILNEEQNDDVDGGS